MGLLNDTTELPESEPPSDVESVDRESIHTEEDPEEDVAQETTQLPSLQELPNALLYDEDLIQNHFMCVQIPHAHKFWKAYSCVKDIPATEAILKLPNPENWIQTWKGCISMFAHLLHHYASHYYCGGITDLEDWSDIIIQYPQGISCSLGELLSYETKVEEFLLR